VRGRNALIIGVAVLLAVPGMVWAQSSASTDVAPVPLSPGVTSVPDAPLPAPSPPSSAPLPAPDLPQSSLAVPPGLTGGDAALPPGAAMTSNSQDSGTSQSSHATAPAEVPPVWLRRSVAVVDVLDKEDGAVRRIKVPVGSSATEGRLSVDVGACLVRPPEMTPDAAIFITVTSRAPDTAVTDVKDQDVSAPLFRGWLIRSEPGATVVGDAAVTFRLIGCDAGQ
jgi:hypothetical protein